METKTLRPYLKIFSPDEKYFVWVKRPDIDKRAYMLFNFGEHKAKFADMIDKLAYMNVEEVKQLDEMDNDTFVIIFSFNNHDSENYRYLIDDIPSIMHHILYEQ